MTNEIESEVVDILLVRRFVDTMSARASEIGLPMNQFGFEMMASGIVLMMPGCGMDLAGARDAVGVFCTQLTNGLRAVMQAAAQAEPKTTSNDNVVEMKLGTRH